MMKGGKVKSDIVRNIVRRLKKILQDVPSRISVKSEREHDVVEIEVIRKTQAFAIWANLVFASRQR